ncbi:hypothetical protein GEMRC1_004224 [Eukaryota sp. GEM-RC1]
MAIIYSNSCPLLWKNKRFFGIIFVPGMWESLFSAHLKDTPLKNDSSLPSAVCKLQNQLTKKFQLLGFINRISVATTNSPEFAAFLMDLCNSGPSGYISQIPKVFGLHLSDEA